MIIHSDCLEAMRTMAADSIDAIVTDPPAGIAFMGKKWDGDKGGRRQWIAWLTERMAEALRVLTPGGHAFVWALPRTSHWTATALEDAGFEIRDIVTHVQGQGFPKSKALLKPSSEHWILCRKLGPLRHLRIDESRVPGEPRPTGTVRPHAESGVHGILGADHRTDRQQRYDANLPAGRWPANFVLSHADCNPGQCAPGCPVAMLDEQSGVRKPGWFSAKAKRGMGYMGSDTSDDTGPACCIADTGTASRFFHRLDPDPFIYQAKASRSDRGEGNTHPTVKSTALMRHLVRLVAAPGDLVLDPFAGSGSTGVACMREGVRFIGIEQDAESVITARSRCEAEIRT